MLSPLALASSIASGVPDFYHHFLRRLRRCSFRCRRRLFFAASVQH
jgi:hypothetical protein